MLRDCPQCHAHDVEMAVHADEAVLVCPRCDHEKAFRMPPLCVVTGAAGVGKSTVRTTLQGEVDALLLEDDVFWDDAFESVPEAAFNDYVLRCLADLAQSGVQPVLFTTGMGVPDNVEDLDARRFFADTQYLALVCDEEEQAERLRSRPNWEDDDAEWAGVDAQVTFNRWFRDNADAEGIDTLDTTVATVEETAAAVREWLSAHSAPDDS